MRNLLLTILYMVCACSPKNLCSGFTEAVVKIKDPYITEHGLRPLTNDVLALGRQYLPNIWIHPSSWQPIEMADYFRAAKIINTKSGAAIKSSDVIETLRQMPHEEQCEHFLDGPPTKASANPPLYLTAFKDSGPDGTEGWTYLKYNIAFDYSGMAKQRTWLADVGRFLTGASARKWHRFDIHTAFILGFDPKLSLKTLTLTQHNYQKTYLAGTDFDPKRPIEIAAALDTNELYLDNGSEQVQKKRVVPFFDDINYLITGENRPFLWAEDHILGRNAGAVKISMHLEELNLDHPLANFAGLLAPPKRVLGYYVGRDGPPGMNFYALPDYFALPDFVALGYWREDDLKMADELKEKIKGPMDTDWKKVASIMRAKLKKDL